MAPRIATSGQLMDFEGSMLWLSSIAGLRRCFLLIMIPKYTLMTRGHLSAMIDLTVGSMYVVNCP